MDFSWKVEDNYSPRPPCPFSSIKSKKSLPLRMDDCTQSLSDLKIYCLAERSGEVNVGLGLATQHIRQAGFVQGPGTIPPVQSRGRAEGDRRGNCSVSSWEFYPIWSILKSLEYIADRKQSTESIWPSFESFPTIEHSLHAPTQMLRQFQVFRWLIKQAFFLDISKKTQAEKNSSKFSKKTQANKSKTQYFAN